MARRGDFNAEDWATIAQAPILAAASVIVADKGGTVRESLALGRAYVKAREDHEPSTLLDELLAESPSLDHGVIRDAGGDIGRQSAERLGEAIGLLEEHAPEDVAAYKTFVRRVADAVARAHKEGGVLGIGGKEVSESEQRALDAIDAVLAGDDHAT